MNKLDEQKNHHLLCTEESSKIQKAGLNNRTDPISTVEPKRNDKISELTKKEHIKVHKPELALRRIISYTRIIKPTSRTSQFVKNILSTAYDTNNGYHTNDSYEFANSIHEYEIPQDYELISLDIVSFSTNITIEIA
ncbi:hypothetical protein WA026_008595, partial [Henosepilachna vigintioctopunctata]